MLEEKTMVSSGYWLELLAAGRSCLLIIRTAQPRHGEREQGTDRPTEQATTSFKVGEKYHEHNSEQGMGVEQDMARLVVGCSLLPTQSIAT